MMDEMMPAPPAGRAACGSCGVTRRNFLAASTLAAVVAVLDACSNALGIDGFNGSYGGPFTVKLSSFAALASVNGVARVDGGSGAPTALVRTGTSSFVALSMVCTHQGSTINITSGGFTCPNHGARFSTTGGWVGGQPTSGLQAYATTYDATTGTVTVNRPA
jgi:cytochrome b6-f complex iron-sulfur subunit